MACILQHVPFKERLSCAYVCRAWAAAAVAVPAEIVVRLNSSARCMQLQHWLRKHRDVAVQITVQGQRGKEPLLQLPVASLSQLRFLELRCVRAELLVQGLVTDSSARSQQGCSHIGESSNAASSGGNAAPAAAAAVLPQLQELKLSDCQLTVEVLLQLLGTATLTKLQWEWVQVRRSSSPQMLPLQQVLATVWQQLRQLPKLSELQLSQAHLTAEDVTPVSNLECLQHLSVRVLNRADTATIAAAVPAGLTALTLRCLSAVPVNPDMQEEVSLARLTHLQSFSSRCLCTRFANLAGITGLQQLRLHHPVGVFRQQLSQSGARDLLAAVQHLTQLQHLELQTCSLGCVVRLPQHQGADSFQCFSALTASTQLTALVLQDHVILVPQAAFHHMFPAGRALPNLKVLHLSRTGYHPLSRQHVDTLQVGMIAASCPALQELTLRGVTPDKFDTSCLLQLPPGVTRVEGLGWVRPAP